MTSEPDDGDCRPMSLRHDSVVKPAGGLSARPPVPPAHTTLLNVTCSAYISCLTTSARATAMRIQALSASSAVLIVTFCSKPSSLVCQRALCIVQCLGAIHITNLGPLVFSVFEVRLVLAHSSGILQSADLTFQLLL